MRSAIILTVFAILLTGCASNSIDDGSYLRVSQGSYGAKLMQWLGLAAEGQYCQISTSEGNSYVWTSEDLDFFIKACGVDAERVQIIRDVIGDS